MTVNVPVPSFPASSVTVTVHTLVVLAVTTAGVNTPEVTLYVPPSVQTAVGVSDTPPSSVTVKTDVAVDPDATVSVSGSKVKTGAVVSGGGGGVMVTVNVPVPVFPAASPAVAVHSLVVSDVTAAAVKTFVATSNAPPFVQETVGPVVTPRASVADKVDDPVASD